MLPPPPVFESGLDADKLIRTNSGGKIVDYYNDEQSNCNIVYIDYHHTKKYDGEYIVLPVSMPMVDYYPHGFADRFSDRIIPVFLGLTMVKETLSKEEINYLKKYEPIGCRDERTLNTMRKYGIISYLHGCITVTLPRRKDGDFSSVYIVDVDQRFIDIIPDELKNNAQYRTHLRSDVAENPKLAAWTQYQEYINDAGLVITSLLHCAVPCLAAGVPVILLKSQVSYRMSWLEKLLPIYTLSDIDKINWNPTAPDIEAHKKKVLDLTIKRLKETYDKYADICDLSYFYETRKKHTYTNDACESLRNFVDQNWTDVNGSYEYSIWGLTQIAEWLVDYISNKYRNAKLCHVYDAFREKEIFRGLISEAPENMKQRPNETILVTFNGGEKIAIELFNSFNFSRYAMFTPVK